MVQYGKVYDLPKTSWCQAVNLEARTAAASVSTAASVRSLVSRPPRTPNLVWESDLVANSLHSFNMESEPRSQTRLMRLDVCDKRELRVPLPVLGKRILQSWRFMQTQTRRRIQKVDASLGSHTTDYPNYCFYRLPINSS